MDGVFIFNAVMSIYITLIYIMRKNLTCFSNMLIADGFKTSCVIET